MSRSIASTDPLQRQTVANSQPVPGWVASCVLHLVVVSFFLSLPVTLFAPSAGRTPLILQASFPHAAIEVSSIAVIQPPAETADHSESIESPEPLSWQSPPALSDSVTEPLQEPLPSDVTHSEGVESTESTEPSESEGRSRPRKSSPSRSQVNTARGIPRSEVLAARHIPRRMPHQSMRPRDWPTRVQQKEFDDIIDRFIQFDIGQLRGKDGRRAMVEFQALGPESVPALVRGLNQSASIQYSCPVGVITSKLAQVILQAKDSGLTNYVMRNLGQGVPITAPHFDRLQQLKTYLSNQSKQSSQPIQEELRRRNLPVSRELIALIEDLNRASADELNDEIRWGDPLSRTASLMGLLEHAERFSPEERLQFAEPLLQLLSQKDTVSAGLSHEALVKLADGLDFGHQPKDRQQWIEFWKGMKASMEKSRLGDDESLHPTQDDAPHPAS